jgi:hypothetical protein
MKHPKRELPKLLIPQEHVSLYNLTEVPPLKGTLLKFEPEKGFQKFLNKKKFTCKLLAQSMINYPSTLPPPPPALADSYKDQHLSAVNCVRHHWPSNSHQ